MDAATIISAVISQSGTDASRPTLLSILNERYLEQVAQSQWLLQQVSLGPSVAGQAAYPLPSTPEIIEVLGLKVGGYPWDRIGQQDMWQLQAGTVVASVGRCGVFAPDYSTAGVPSVVLYPTPTGSGTQINAIAACLPAALTDISTSIPVTPTDLHGSLIDATTSVVLRRIDERADLAAPYETVFTGATEEMRKRKNSLIRGRGPVQIGVAGYHFDNR